MRMANIITTPSMSHILPLRAKERDLLLRRYGSEHRRVRADDEDFHDVEMPVLGVEFADLAAFDVGDVGDGAHDFLGIDADE
jgi:hypothetical protein